jgi:hypothetical protein
MDAKLPGTELRILFLGHHLDPQGQWRLDIMLVSSASSSLGLSKIGEHAAIILSDVDAAK